MVKQGYLNVSYAAHVIPVGPFQAANLQPKRFRNEARACAEAVALLRLMQKAESEGS